MGLDREREEARAQLEQAELGWSKSGGMSNRQKAGWIGLIVVYLNMFREFWVVTHSYTDTIIASLLSIGPSLVLAFLLHRRNPDSLIWAVYAAGLLIVVSAAIYWKILTS